MFGYENLRRKKRDMLVEPFVILIDLMNLFTVLLLLMMQEEERRWGSSRDLLDGKNRLAAPLRASLKRPNLHPISM
jgi:hypothetical protein